MKKFFNKEALRKVGRKTGIIVVHAMTCTAVGFGAVSLITLAGVTAPFAAPVAFGVGAGVTSGFFGDKVEKAVTRRLDSRKQKRSAAKNPKPD